MKTHTCIQNKVQNWSYYNKYTNDKFTVHENKYYEYVGYIIYCKGVLQDY